MLGPLSDNGGPTQTMALLPGSPALDAGTLTCYPADQRGVTRPQGAACEIGAYEVPYQTVIRYVKWDAKGANNGTSWLDAYTELQAALTAASSGDQIWVAAGTYKPTAGTDRTASFQLKNGVAIYGGFAGTETSRAFLNFETNITVLSGDMRVEMGFMATRTTSGSPVVIPPSSPPALLVRRRNPPRGFEAGPPRASSSIGSITPRSSTSWLLDATSTLRSL